MLNRTVAGVVVWTLAIALLAGGIVQGREYHVSPRGNDANDGSATRMLATISAAAKRARPADVITVHEGVYRERIDPPRGGASDDQRIVYRAAPGERVVVKGSEVVKGWKKVGNDTWKVTLPDSFFGDLNPYRDRIAGDWFNGRGRVHHTGAVYLDGHWLTETARKSDVLAPAGENPLWYTDDAAAPVGGFLLNVAWIRVGDGARIPAARYSAQRGLQKAPCSEGGQCIGFIEAGDWAKYAKADFGGGAKKVELRVASDTGGGRIELRADGPKGKLLGTGSVAHTGGWQKWSTIDAKIEATRGVKTLCLLFKPHGADTDDEPDSDTTTIWAQFKGVDPNESGVEINVRQSIFYPQEEGRNYITVRGFTLEHAATPWAPPTAEQIGLIGTHWSKGWIIEDNVIRYSTCVGVTLGKHGDEFDNTSQNSAEGYVETIHRGLARGWSKENIGHHVVRRNLISHCEQAGIVGSLGPVFCEVSNNVIHDIHVRRLFTGAEMAGIKFHAPIDTVIRDNHIYRTNRGIWLDWMTQGTRVTRNLLHDNGPSEDLFVEVNHGPFLVDHNIMLSPVSLLVNSRGGAFAHNLMVGAVRVIHTEGRQTPYHPPHSTEVAGLHANPSGDDRFYNNLLVGGFDLTAYDPAALPVFMGGNVFLAGAKPSEHESDPLVFEDFDPVIKLTEDELGWRLEIEFDPAWAAKRTRSLVTTELLGRAKVPDAPYEHADGSPFRLDTDFFGMKRDSDNPFPGPLAHPEDRDIGRCVWRGLLPDFREK